MTDLLLKLFVKNSSDTKNPKVRSAIGTLGSTAGIFCNVLLFGIKLIAGLISGSVSIMADAFNNLSDMGSSVVTLLGIKLAGKPADKDHPFGHGRIEYMSAFIVASLILLMGFELLKSSVQKIISPVSLEIKLIIFIIMAISVIVKLWMFLFNKKLSKKINSGALSATASDSLNDAITTFVILLSMVVQYFSNINLDPYTGTAVSLFILYSGFKLCKESLDPMLGMPPDQELIDDIEKIIMSYECFVGLHDLIVHNYGPGRVFASLHVEVSQYCDIVYVHEQVDLCERDIQCRLGIELVIHMDPIDSDNESLNTVKSVLSDMIKEIHPDLTLHDFRMTPKAETRTNLIFDVVVPTALKISDDELCEKIGALAREIDPTHCCVITLDRNYVGK